MSGYASDLTVKAKLLPRHSQGALPLASAAEMSLTTASPEPSERYRSPYE